MNKISGEDHKVQSRDTNIKLGDYMETTVSMPEEQPQQPQQRNKYNPYKWNKNMWTFFPQRQRKTEFISESKAVAALHSTVEYLECHVLTGHRESKLHSELAGSALI